jgi:hypothetical protein
VGRITKLHQTGSDKDFIMAFEHLAIKTEGLSYSFYLECFIGGLKEVIQAHVNMHHPTTRFQTCQLAMEVETILQAPPMKALVLNRPHPKAHPTLT